MQKNFKLIISVLLVTASSFGAVAQTETFKDVILDGKPAKLNKNTGDVVLVGATKTSQSEANSKDTEINSNLITTNASNKSKPERTTSNITDTLSKTKLGKESISMSSEIQKNTPISTHKQDTPVTSSDHSFSSSHSKNNSNYHKVEKGETLYALSKRYNTTIENLKKANNLDTSHLNVGQNLRVRHFESSSSRQTSNIWTVSKGDTLYSIAKRNNTTVASIKSLNGLTSNLILIGQKLQLN